MGLLKGRLKDAIIGKFLKALNAQKTAKLEEAATEIQASKYDKPENWKPPPPKKKKPVKVEEDEDALMDDDAPPPPPSSAGEPAGGEMDIEAYAQYWQQLYQVRCGLIREGVPLPRANRCPAVLAGGS